MARAVSDVDAAVARAVSDFEAAFGRRPEARATAPGRINLIGEHTDYTGGYVLPAPVPLITTATAAKASGRELRVCSSELGSASFVLGAERRTGTWVDYVAGVTHELAARGHRVAACDVHLRTELPLGGGLSSSAALEVALVRALAQLFELDLDDREAAAVGHDAENGLVGAHTGVMDQLAASVGRQGEALLIDCSTITTQPIALPKAIELAVIDSGVRHRLAGGAYNLRRAETERAAAALGGTLREIDPSDPRLAALPDPLGRRGLHVASENARVLGAVAALGNSDGEAFGNLVDASHASLAHAFDVSTPELDRLAELAREQGALGARLTGAGFGGSLLIVAQAGRGREIARRTVEKFNARGGCAAVVLTLP